MPVKHDVGEPRAEPVAVRAAVDLAGHRRGPLARAGGQFGRRQLERRQALARVPSCKGDGLQGALADRLTRLGRQPCAEQRGRPSSTAPIRVRSVTCEPPLPSDSRSNTGPKRRNGPFVNTRDWRKCRPAIHSYGFSSHSSVKPAALPRPRRRTVPFGCGVCSSVYGGRPIASLNRLVSASTGQSRSGGRSNVQVQVAAHESRYCSTSGRMARGGSAGW